ncbi:MAG TPA: biotin--[acetyl-CoA-carboxylase] ligase [Steroidobacteraceae bacterium]|nr:biotin--[acetyl-CoA-carboxylase] ligase [Steroidobacteraceae bacterium]
MSSPAGGSLAERLYAQLAIGGFHSGETLATTLGVSRSGIWKAAGQLRALGMELHAVPNRGYRLAHASAPLRADAIRAGLDREVAVRLRRGEVAWNTGSTNADLLARGELAPGQFDFLLAEYQSAGRGRRGRSWLAPPGGALCFSCSWSFGSLPAAASALSLAVGVWTRRALRRLGVTDVQLKWPNDLVTPDGKLGGILIELRAEASGLAQVVIGLGLNVVLDRALREQVRASGTRAVDLQSLGLGGCDRNALAALLLNEFIPGLLQFEREGFAPFIAEWRAADCLRGMPIRFSGGAQGEGIARGIDASGALQVLVDGRMQPLISGEVTVRAQP